MNSVSPKLTQREITKQKGYSDSTLKLCIIDTKTMSVYESANNGPERPQMTTKKAEIEPVEPNTNKKTKFIGGSCEEDLEIFR